jgi:peptide/nickel transport system permease protein
MAVAERASPGQTGRPVVARPSPLARLRHQLETLWRSKVALVGLALVLFWVLVALFADNCIISPSCWVKADGFESTPWLARYSPLEQFRGETLQGPSARHWLGTDRQGRDLWARLAHGSRIILILAPLSVGLALIVGGTLGIIAGYYGGVTDEVTMRFLDALMAFPQILLYLVIIAAVGPSVTNIMLAITIAGAPGIARLWGWGCRRHRLIGAASSTAGDVSFRPATPGTRCGRRWRLRWSWSG